MGMTRSFKTVNDDAALNLTVSLREARPLIHPARFVANVKTLRDSRSLYARDGIRGGELFAPEMLLGGCSTVRPRAC